VKENNKVLEKGKELFSILDKLVLLHRNLIDALQEEYSHMGNVDVKSLQEVARTKEALLNEIWNCENSRIRSAEELCFFLEIPIQNATVSSIALQLSHTQSEILKNYRTVLDMLVAQTKELNKRNQAFAEQSLVRIEEMKRNVLGLNNNNQENYSSSGTRQTLNQTGGRLLSTEA
jgi:hypothetical protein